MKGAAMTFNERLQAYRNRRKSFGEPDRLWFDAGEAALLLAEPVDAVVRHCRGGQLESRWIDQPDGGRIWYVFETELERWIREGPRETMGFEAAMGLVSMGKAVRRVAWNDLEHVTGWLEENEVQALKHVYILDFDGRRSMDWEPVEEDRRALDWVEHDSHPVLHPPPAL
jgi:hypothetical protein